MHMKTNAPPVLITLWYIITSVLIPWEIITVIKQTFFFCLTASQTPDIVSMMVPSFRTLPWPAIVGRDELDVMRGHETSDQGSDSG